MVSQLVLIDGDKVSCWVFLHDFSTGVGAHAERGVDGQVRRRIIDGKRRVVLILVDGVHPDPLAAGVRFVHEPDHAGAVLVHRVVVRVPVVVCAVKLVLAVARFLCSWHPVFSCGRR